MVGENFHKDVLLSPARSAAIRAATETLVSHVVVGVGSSAGVDREDTADEIGVVAVAGSSGTIGTIGTRERGVPFSSAIVWGRVWVVERRQGERQTRHVQDRLSGGKPKLGRTKWWNQPITRRGIRTCRGGKLIDGKCNEGTW